MSRKVDGKLVNMEKNIKAPLQSGTRTIYNNKGEVIKVEEAPKITAPVSLELDTDKAVKANEVVENYNNSLYENRDPLVDKLEIVGAKVMVRFFKLHMYTKDGMYVGGRNAEVPTESGTKKKIIQLPEEFQFQERGVVVKIGLGCSDKFKEIIKVGDVVDIENSLPGAKAQRWLHKDTIGQRFDNYFIVPEYLVEMKVNLK